MESKSLRSKFVLALLPLFVLCFVVFMNTALVSFSTDKEDDNAASVSSLYTTEEQKEDMQHDPVYISIFKFIMNCNPFQKETQL